MFLFILLEWSSCFYSKAGRVFSVGHGSNPPLHPLQSGPFPTTPAAPSGGTHLSGGRMRGGCGSWFQRMAIPSHKHSDSDCVEGSQPSRKIRLHLHGNNNNGTEISQGEPVHTEISCIYLPLLDKSVLTHPQNPLAPSLPPDHLQAQSILQPLLGW